MLWLLLSRASFLFILLLKHTHFIQMKSFYCADACSQAFNSTEQAGKNKGACAHSCTRSPTFTVQAHLTKLKPFQLTELHNECAASQKNCIFTYAPTYLAYLVKSRKKLDPTVPPQNPGIVR